MSEKTPQINERKLALLKRESMRTDYCFTIRKAIKETHSMNLHFPFVKEELDERLGGFYLTLPKGETVRVDALIKLQEFVKERFPEIKGINLDTYYSKIRIFFELNIRYGGVTWK